MKITDLIYRAFGEADDNEQAWIINLLGRSLIEACKFDHSKVEGQLCWVSSKIDKHGEEFILQLAEFIKLRKAEGFCPNNGQEG